MHIAIGVVLALVALAAGLLGVAEIVHAFGNHGEAPGWAVAFVGVFFLAIAAACAAAAREAFRGS